ncbi:MAG: hypothetical protein ACREM8_02645 [Vulcanimicrobiaceae bacterium]
MGFNLLPAIVGGLEGLAGGGPVGAVAGAAAGGFAGHSPGNIAGAAGNAALQGLLGASEADQLANEAMVMQSQSRLQWQSSWFNEMLSERAESQREGNELRNVAMAQRQADDKIVKEFIRTIAD